MFKIIKRWIKYWKQGRKAKKYIKQQLLLSSRREPYEITQADVQAVISDWKAVGVDITVPNFSGGTFRLGTDYGNR